MASRPRIHFRANCQGLPIGIVLTPGQTHDSTVYAALMAERDSDPDALLGDRGYDSDPIRNDVRAKPRKAPFPRADD